MKSESVGLYSPDRLIRAQAIFATAATVLLASFCGPLAWGQPIVVTSVSPGPIVPSSYVFKLRNASNAPVLGLYIQDRASTLPPMPLPTIGVGQTLEVGSPSGLTATLSDPVVFGPPEAMHKMSISIEIPFTQTNRVNILPPDSDKEVGFFDLGDTSWVPQPISAISGPIDAPSGFANICAFAPPSGMPTTTHPITINVINQFGNSVATLTETVPDGGGSCQRTAVSDPFVLDVVGDGVEISVEANGQHFTHLQLGLTPAPRDGRVLCYTDRNCRGFAGEVSLFMCKHGRAPGVSYRGPDGACHDLGE